MELYQPAERLMGDALNGRIVESVLAPPTEACLAFEPLRAPRGQRFALPAHGLRAYGGYQQ